jgi:hypothetical protein
VALALVALSLWACDAYDPSLLPGPAGANGGSGGAGGMDSSVGGTGEDGGPPEDGGDACVSSAVEVCNRVDDNCDGEVDEGADVMCSQLMHAESECVPFGNSARCVMLGECHEGYDRCDGDPANGCEPYCSCNVCDDAGTEDAGE